MHPCRLCHGPTRHRFERRVLGRYDVAYLECLDCGSLQTEPPHWLAEAYAIPGVHIDVGQAARVVQTWLRLCFLLRNIEFDVSLPCIDYGGSAGLLTRLMRDSGYLYYAFDLYDGSKYANYFRVDDILSVDAALISAFEVFEHFPDPRSSIEEILKSRAELIVFTTQFYEDQDENWDYLVPFCGQHVFFYTERGLARFAAAHGYDLRRTDDFNLLIRRGSRSARAIDSQGARAMTAAFISEHVAAVGWGTAATLRDHTYAKERFVRELATSIPPAPPPRRPLWSGVARWLSRR